MELQINILKAIQTICNPILDKVFESITILGESTSIVLYAAVIFLCIDKKKGYRIVFTLMSGTCINGIVKNIFKVKRPIGVEGIRSQRIETATSYSFPSGHTQSTTTFWTAASLAFKNNFLYIFTVAIIALVGFSRMYLGVHWPTDVLGAIIIGSIWALIFGKIFDYIDSHKAYWLLISLAGVYAIICIFIGDNDYYKSSGLLLGLAVGYFIEDKYINFSIKMGVIRKAISFIIMLGGLLLVKGLLKVILPSGLIFNMLRYGLAGLWAFGISPLLIKKFVNQK